LGLGRYPQANRLTPAHWEYPAAGANCSLPSTTAGSMALTLPQPSVDQVDPGV